MTAERGWSAETEAAFLAALAELGTVKGACAAIGKWPTNAYQYRKTAPDFAARWDAVVARLTAERVRARIGEVRDGAGMIPRYRVRRDGWTEARQKAFLRALSETGCVRDACKRVRISNVSAYRIRKRSAAFARAWDRALAKAAPTIEQAAYDRAVAGWEEPIVHGGKVVATRRRYSDSLLRLLLTRGVAGAGAGSGAGGAEGEPADAVRLPELSIGEFGRLRMADGTPVEARSPVGQAFLASVAERQGVQDRCDGSGYWEVSWDGTVAYASQIEAKAEVLRRIELLRDRPDDM
ncbi:hypothetical protein [Stakelama tenebrarum]|uniref:Uncharacterized protein n=1 Tax=Stakelama tenebrarum TaxID=2711215 RepID=A0A6G6Y326_9SPHN|nr:hypothetical protein [Sphingosinithalassobacter tenebrarum]QIG79300.1 hypothetical protein G5C33_05505 [Sphingosinithalassobacter tenebrarum]